jgi:hypothetical protein
MGHRLRLPPIGDICGKRRFHNPTEADAFAAVIQRGNQLTGRGKPGRRLQSYFCDRCQAYHIGHAPKGE